MVRNKRHPLPVSETGTCLPWVSSWAAGQSALCGLFLLIHKPNTHQPVPLPTLPSSHLPILVTLTNSTWSSSSPPILLIHISSLTLFYLLLSSPLVLCPVFPPNTRSIPPPHQPVLISITAALTHRFLPSNLRLAIYTFTLFLPLHYVGNSTVRNLPCSAHPQGSLLPTAAPRQLIQSCFFSCLTHNLGVQHALPAWAALRTGKNHNTLNITSDTLAENLQGATNRHLGWMVLIRQRYLLMQRHLLCQSMGGLELFNKKFVNILQYFLPSCSWEWLK